MKTNTGLVEWCKERLANKEGYVYGAYFDRVITQAYLDAKQTQYPTQYTSAYMKRTQIWLGKVAGDCIGLIKSYIWETDGKVTLQKISDKSADGMFNLATIKGKINTMPDTIGLCVRYKGHVGVYIGNNEVIEARGADYGVVKTKLSERGWTDWYECPHLNYGGGEIMLQKGSKGENVKSWQRVLKADGENVGNFGKNKDGIDGDFGATSVNATNSWKKKHGLAENGVVDLETYSKVGEKYAFLVSDVVQPLNKKHQEEVDKRAKLEVQVKKLSDEIVVLNKSILTLTAEKKTLEVKLSTEKNQSQIKDSSITTLENKLMFANDEKAKLKEMNEVLAKEKLELINENLDCIAKETELERERNNLKYKIILLEDDILEMQACIYELSNAEKPESKSFIECIVEFFKNLRRK